MGADASCGGLDSLKRIRTRHPTSINRGNDDYTDDADFANRSWLPAALLAAARGGIREIREIVFILLMLAGVAAPYPAGSAPPSLPPTATLPSRHAQPRRVA